MRKEGKVYINPTETSLRAWHLEGKRRSFMEDLLG